MTGKGRRMLVLTALLAAVAGSQTALADDPGTAIQSGPSGITRDDTPTFVFRSTEEGSTFECRVARPGADAPWRPCTSPYSIDLEEGDWVFSVRAIDRAGNVDPSPASREFTVDRGGVNTYIDAGPAGTTIDTTPTFTFGSDVTGATFECRLEGESSPLPDFTACSAPYQSPRLHSGAWALRVRAVAPGGRVDPTPAARRFTVDADRPETDITGGPAEGATIGTRRTTFQYRSEPGAKFACRLDNRRVGDSDSVEWKPCAETGFDTPELAGGRHTFEVRATDPAGNEDSTPASRTFTVSVCEPVVHFGLVEAESRCLRNEGTEEEPRWVSDDDVKLNGLPLPAPGPAKVVLEGPSAANPGGTVALSDARVSVAGVDLVRGGSLKWKLPAGEAGQEQDVARIDLSKAGQALFGLKIQGSAALRLGLRSNGKDYYSVMALNVALPEVVKAGPNQSAPSVTGDVAVAIDRTGPKLDGLKIKVDNAYIGKLGVRQLCLSFVRAGGTVVAPCDPPRIGPVLPDKPTGRQCRTDNNADRFDGSLILGLPTGTELGIWGGTYGGRLSYAGALAEGLAVPIAPGVLLRRVAVNVCVYPPPFSIQGEAGVGFGPVTPQGQQAARIDGSFSYRDAWNGQPWEIAAGGKLTMFGYGTAGGNIRYQSTGLLDFDFGAQFKFGPASIEGGVKGWVETGGGGRFNVEGNVLVCVDKVACAQAQAIISSIGAAGCVKVTAAKVKVPAWSWSRGFYWREVTVDITGGAGYRWQTRKLDLLIGSCSMDQYRAQRPGRVIAAGAGQSTDSFDVEPGQPAYAVRLRGDGAPPRVTLVSEDGTRRISSPAGGGGAIDADANQADNYMLAENDEDDTTQVMIANPQAGRWKIEPQEGSAPVTAVEPAGTLPEPGVAGHVSGHGHDRTLEYAYSPLDGQQITFVEKGPHTEQRLGVAKGGKCPERVEGDSDGRPVLCGKLRFSPGDGPAGKREILAIVEQGDEPRKKPLTAATYQAPATAMPARPRGLKLRRRGSRLIVSWRGSAGNIVRYNALVTYDGRRRLFIKKAGAHRIVVPRVPKRSAVRVSLRGMRLDTVEGPAAKARLGKVKGRRR